MKTNEATVESTVWEQLLQAVGLAHPNNVENLKQLSEAQWENLLSLSVEHWVTPLVYRMLLTRGADLEVPKATLQAFKLASQKAEIRSTRFFEKLHLVLSAFKEVGIDVLALKGTHLAALVYGDIALRPMNDVDLLIHHADLEAAARVLTNLGFYQDPVNQRNCRYQATDDDTCHHLKPFQHPDAPPIELHYALETPSKIRTIDTEDLWSRANLKQIAGVDVFILSPEDLLLHLCLHIAIHHVFQVKLLSLCDIPTVIEHYREQIDWVTFWNRAKTWGIKRAALITFALVERRLGYSIPKEATIGLQPPIDVDRDFLDIAERSIREKAATLARLNPPDALDFSKFIHTHSLPEINRSRIMGVITRPSIEHFSDNLSKLWTNPTLFGKAMVILNRVFLSRRELGEIFGISPDSHWLPLFYPVRAGQLLVRYAYFVVHALWKESKSVALLRDGGARNRLKNWLLDA